MTLGYARHGSVVEQLLLISWVSIRTFVSNWIVHGIWMYKRGERTGGGPRWRGIFTYGCSWLLLPFRRAAAWAVCALLAVVVYYQHIWRVPESGRVLIKDVCIHNDSFTVPAHLSGSVCLPAVWKWVANTLSTAFCDDEALRCYQLEVLSFFCVGSSNI